MVESLVLHADFAQLPHLYLAKKRYYLFTEFVNRIILYSVKDADSLPSFHFLCESLMWINVKHKPQNNFIEITPPFIHYFVEK